MDINDELEIIKNCKRGLLSDFSFLYDSYIKKIYGFIYFKVQSREVAQDITSATFLKALDKIKSYDPGKGKFSSWLYQIARNKVIDYYRAKKPHIPIEDAWDLKDDTNIQADLEIKMKLEKVKEYLQKLNPAQREIIILRLWTISNIREKMPLLLIFIAVVVHSVNK